MDKERGRDGKADGALDESADDAREDGERGYSADAIAVLAGLLPPVRPRPNFHVGVDDADDAQAEAASPRS